MGLGKGLGKGLEWGVDIKGEEVRERIGMDRIGKEDKFFFGSLGLG
jgi:hypothetical protein